MTGAVVIQYELALIQLIVKIFVKQPSATGPTILTNHDVNNLPNVTQVQKQSKLLDKRRLDDGQNLKRVKQCKISGKILSGELGHLNRDVKLD